MAGCLRPLHQLRRPAKVGVLTRGVHESVDFSRADDRTREHRLAGFVRGG